MSSAELPELEILRRDLDKEVSGKKIKAVDVPGKKSIARAGTPKALATRLTGVKIERVTRKGTWISLAFDSGDVMLVALGAKSRPRRAQNKDALDPGTAVVLTFTQHGQLRLIDPASTAELFLVPSDEVAATIGSLGLDLVDEPVSWTKFGEMVLRRSGKLKSILMDPTMLVGIGAMYSDEILFEAGLRYDRSPDTLSTQEIRRLYRASVEIIHDSVKHGGASVGDDGYLTLSGARGGYSDMINVFRRDGEMSPRARGPIVKSRFGNGYTYYCEQTQV